MPGPSAAALMLHELTLHPPLAASPSPLPGMRYRFPNTARDGWIQRGERRGVLLFRRQVVREGDEEAAALEAEELRRQLATNEGLSGEDRALLVARLQALGAKTGRRRGSKA